MHTSESSGALRIIRYISKAVDYFQAMAAIQYAGATHVENSFDRL
jgi:hypothetical protein